MSRSKWKGFFIEKNYLNSKLIQTKSKIKIWSRSSTVSELLIGTTVNVYNGQKFKPVKITRDKVGFKFGEFSFTRKMYRRIKKKKIIKKK
jgi:small subunit ribosomal protein S19